ncbi:glycosyltransferase [Sphingobacterium sp. lm-10]|uniref:glycosyltransferase n=1 Tax=Sphingobacterium sp. lm-10 TaxID=2944904 RepID=UPI002021ED02|nr:glycosyltransferase [Sphingobacterium sp. lm-10]MCL7987372.1 glycosyltransferase [Sphingobacterium sp. lm-10]
MFFSIIIPLYNRPQEIHELLQSLTQQQYRDFEVIVVEDGSRIQANDIVEAFSDRLDVHYFLTENTGQGFARNYGFQKAKGDFFIVLDSDVIVPVHYLQEVAAGLLEQQLDAFGGPDGAHASFSSMQKAISYTMTSPLTTGGIRGNKKHIGPFHPRSFNMGISRAVWEQTKGFRLSRRSEDIEFSIRMIAEGFHVGLIPKALVYHKRRTDLSQFFRQTYQFGKGRIDIYKIYPTELKWVHALPAGFVIGLVAIAMLTLLNVLTYGGITLFVQIAYLGYALLLIYTFALFAHALKATKDLSVALQSVPAAYVQLVAYGSGFIQNYMDKIWFQK